MNKSKSFLNRIKKHERGEIYKQQTTKIKQKEIKSKLFLILKMRKKKTKNEKKHLKSHHQFKMPEQ